MYNLDVMVMASSRPDLLKVTMEKFNKFIHFFGKLRFLIHEDFVYPEISKQSVKWAESWGFDVILGSLPKIGVGYAMDKMFKLIESDYVFYMQDDWEFERPVELDRILWTMENYKKINCITFNKYRNMKPNHSEGFKDKEYNFDGQRLCIYPGWQFLPGVWRMEIIKKKWSPRKERPEGYWQNQFGDNDKRIKDLKHLEENVGAYMYGGLGEYRYVRHIGSTWRMADWQIKTNNFKPTGCRHWEFMSLKRDRAPWLGEMEARPLNPSVPLTKEGRELLKEQPKYIQEMYK